jgi:hypothetical protein
MQPRQRPGPAHQVPGQSSPSSPSTGGGSKMRPHARIRQRTDRVPSAVRQCCKLAHYTVNSSHLLIGHCLAAAYHAPHRGHQRQGCAPAANASRIADRNPVAFRHADTACRQRTGRLMLDAALRHDHSAHWSPFPQRYDETTTMLYCNTITCLAKHGGQSTCAVHGMAGVVAAPATTRNRRAKVLVSYP